MLENSEEEGSENPQSSRQVRITQDGENLENVSKWNTFTSTKQNKQPFKMLVVKFCAEPLQNAYDKRREYRFV